MKAVTKMKQNVKVSVIMSCLNTPANYLDLAIESLLTQTYKNIEYIFVNNGGNNLEQLMKYKEKDKRIKIINNHETLELPESLNLAIEHTTGKYIARMDSDDYSLPDRIEKQVVFMEKHQNIDVSSMYVKIFGVKDRYAVYPWCTSDEIKASLFFSNEVYHPTVMFRKEFIINNHLKYRKGYNYSEDFDLWNRCCQYGNFTIIPEIGLCYRIHMSNTSTLGSETQGTSKEKVLGENLKRISLGKQYLKYIKSLSPYDVSVSLAETKKFIELVMKKNQEINYFNQKVLKKILYKAFFMKILKQKKENLSVFEMVHVFINANLFLYYIKKITKTVHAHILFKKSCKNIPIKSRRLICN